MSYSFYLGTMLLPVAPGKLTLKINNGNKTYCLMNEGEINALKAPGLTEIQLELLLPNTEYPFAVYKNGFQKASVYLAELERLKITKQTFQFIVSRVLPDGSVPFDTNITCSLEEYSIVEDAEKCGTDIMVSVSLKQYRSYGTKKCKVKKKKKLSISKLRKTKGVHIKDPKRKAVAIVNNCYEIKLTKSMTLYNLAKKVYGKGELYTIIAKANGKTESSGRGRVVLWKKSKKLKKGEKVLVPVKYYS